MGLTNSKKPEITIKAIRANTEDIRSSLRRKKIPLENKDDYYQTLIDNSRKLDTLRSNKSRKKQLEIDQIQKLVSEVSEELLEYNDENLDKNADESHSFIRIGVEDKKKQKKTPTRIRAGYKNSKANKLIDIEEKLERIKIDVSVGLKNAENKSLILQKKKIEMLSTDLELLNIQESSELHEMKENLEKELYKYYQKIIRREKNQARLSKLLPENSDEIEKIKKNSSKLNAIEIMIQDIHDILQNTVKGDDRTNFESLPDELNRIESQLNELEDNSKENLKSKTILLKKIEQTYKQIEKIDKKNEMNGLDDIMEEIDKKKNGNTNNDANSLKLLLGNLVGMKKKLKEFPVKYSENDTFRNEYLQELDKFLEKLDPNHDGVVMRPKKLKTSKSVEDLLHLQKEWSSLEKNISATKLDEVKKVDELLERFEESIKAKRRSLASLLKKQDENRRKSDEPIRTSVKIFDLPKVQSIKSINKTDEVETEQTPIKYGTIEYALEEITKISDRIDQIGKDILKFKGTSEDLEYNFFKASLMDKRKILENLSHRSSWNQVDAFKVEILEKINYFEEYLKYKLDQNILELNVNKKLDDLDTKIKRFTGSYQNIQFKNIDSDLANCSREIQRIDSTETKEKLTQKMNYLKNILKERSYIDQPLKHEENLTDTKKIIAESKEYVEKLGGKIEAASNIDLNESSIIEECLFSKSLELINLNLKNDTPMFRDVKKLLEDIEYLRNVAKSKRRKRETFVDIEKKLDLIGHEISDFDGLATDQKFINLNGQLEDLDIRLGRVVENDFEQGKNLEYSLRINLLKTKLHQIALDSEKILDIERRISKILEMVSDGDEKHFEGLDERLINLKVELDKLDVSEKLSYRKITCLNYIEYLSKKVGGKCRETGQISKSIIV